MMDYLTQALAYIKQYPEILAILLGTFASWAGAALLEGLFVPEAWTARKAQQFTVVVTIVLGTLVSSIAWRVLDPADPRIFRITVSFTCALISPFSYVWAAKLLTHFVPWIGSVWAVQASARTGGTQPEAPKA